MRTPEPGPELTPPVATVEPFPPALPLTPLPDVLATTGSDVVLLAWVCVALAVMCGLLAIVSFRLSPRIKRKGI